MSKTFSTLQEFAFKCFCILTIEKGLSGVPIHLFICLIIDFFICLLILLFIYLCIYLHSHFNYLFEIFTSLVNSGHVA